MNARQKTNLLTGLVLVVALLAGSCSNRWEILHRLRLHIAVEEGDIDTLRAALESGKFDVDGEDATSRTPLYLAALHGNTEAARLLLEHGADINHVAIQKGPETALHMAAGAGHLDVVKLLVSRGADINCRTRFGSTPLCDAAWNSQISVLEWLVANGADVKVVTDNGVTPLSYSYRPEGYSDVIRILAAAGADVNHMGPGDLTALHSAVGENNKKAVMVLLEKGVDPNPPSDVRLSPLALAEKKGFKEIADILREHGAR